MRRIPAPAAEGDSSSSCILQATVGQVAIWRAFSNVVSVYQTGGAGSRAASSQPSADEPESLEHQLGQQEPPELRLLRYGGGCCSGRIWRRRSGKSGDFALGRLHAVPQQQQLGRSVAVGQLSPG